jgi:hypothetical protein
MKLVSVDIERPKHRYGIEWNGSYPLDFARLWREVSHDMNFLRHFADLFVARRIKCVVCCHQRLVEASNDLNAKGVVGVLSSNTFSCRPVCR